MNKTQIAVDIFDKCASLYQDKFMDVSLYHSGFDLFCKSIQKENAEVLELACGPGNITKYLLKKRPDFKLLGTDLAPNMILLAKQNNPTAEFQLMDSRDILKLNKTPARPLGGYDAIMCGFCLPYLTKKEAIQLIEDSAKILNPNGVIYISTMEDDYSKSAWKKGSGGQEMFLHYHEGGYLSEVLLANKFTILDITRQDYPVKDGINDVDLIIVAKK